MKCCILRVLRSESQDWWAHKDLRSAGKYSEAAARERESIRSSIRTIKQMLNTQDAYVSKGRGGTTLHYGRGSTVRSYGGLEHFASARIAVCLGLPFIDTTTVRAPEQLIGLPMVAVGEEPETQPITWLSLVRLSEYARRASAIGAIVVNIDLDLPKQPKRHKTHRAA